MKINDIKKMLVARTKVMVVLETEEVLFKGFVEEIPSRVLDCTFLNLESTYIYNYEKRDDELTIKIYCF